MVNHNRFHALCSSLLTPISLKVHGFNHFNGFNDLNEFAEGERLNDLNRILPWKMTNPFWPYET
jgi:hypothetical protein